MAMDKSVLYLIKDVIISFSCRLEDKTRSFQEICSNFCANNVTPAVKLNLVALQSEN